MFCSQCGKEIEDNSKFCKYCGNTVSPRADEEKKNQKKPAKIAAVAVIVVALVIGAVTVKPSTPEAAIVKGEWVRYDFSLKDTENLIGELRYDFNEDGTCVLQSWCELDGVRGTFGNPINYTYEIDDDFVKLTSETYTLKFPYHFANGEMTIENNMGEEFKHE